MCPCIPLQLPHAASAPTAPHAGASSSPEEQATLNCIRDLPYWLRPRTPVRGERQAASADGPCRPTKPRERPNVAPRYPAPHSHCTRISGLTRSQAPLWRLPRYICPLCLSAGAAEPLGTAGGNYTHGPIRAMWLGSVRNLPPRLDRSCTGMTGMRRRGSATKLGGRHRCVPGHACAEY